MRKNLFETDEPKETRDKSDEIILLLKKILDALNKLSQTKG